MQWFRHDIGAFKDERIQALRIDCGGAAVDAYYAILELIYEGETDLVMSKNQAETKSVLHWLCLGWAGFRQYVEAMGAAGLLAVSVTDEGKPSETVSISSARASEFIGDYHAKAETARQNGKKGGRPKKGNQRKTQSVFDGNPEETDAKANKELRSKNIEKDVSKDTSKKAPKHRHGEYGNVMLTDDELAKLKDRFPADWEQRIQNLDEYIGYKGAKYKSHYLTIINWANRDARRSSPKTYEEVGRERFSEYNRAAV